MRYLVNILCCSLFLFGELESKFKYMAELPKEARKLFDNSDEQCDDFFMQNWQGTQDNQNLSEESYLEICQSLAYANALEKVSTSRRPSNLQNLYSTKRWCDNPNDPYVKPPPNEIKVNGYNENMGPLKLISCNCKFDGPYWSDEIFYFVKLISHHQTYIQFETYSKPDFYYKISNCWKLI